MVPRRGRSLAVVGSAVLAIVGLSASAGVAQGSPPQPAGEAASTARVAPPVTSGARPAGINVADTYVAVTATGSTQYLRLVSKSSGRVTKTVGSIRGAGSTWSAYWSIDLGRDGSVYAVAADRTLLAGFQTSLYKYTSTGVTKLRPYVVSVRVSPDGSRLATVVESPDGDGDGKGLAALRISDTNGKVLRTLMSVQFPVTKTGQTTVHYGGASLTGWLPNGDIAASTSCCDSGSAWVVSSTKPTAVDSSVYSTLLRPRRGSVDGGAGTQVIGYRGNEALAMQIDDYTYDERRLVARWMTKAGPGKRVATYKPGAKSFAAQIADALKKAGATPFEISVKKYPYKGPGKVLEVAQ